VDADACTSVPVGGLDESAGLFTVSAPVAAARPVAAGIPPWSAGVRVARRALAHQLVGVSKQLLGIAVDHVRVREQFGRPLGANQAVQHRLADVQVDLAAAEELVEESWRTDTDLAAVAAKGLADRTLESVGAGGQQVLGAIGYTWEHSWRHALRRGMFLSAFLGSVDECEREVGALLLESGTGGVTRIGTIEGVPA
jgi:alkylation response protein AidB-like acyl-CoA dehydrogenase